MAGREGGWEEESQRKAEMKKGSTNHGPVAMLNALLIPPTLYLLHSSFSPYRNPTSSNSPVYFIGVAGVVTQKCSWFSPQVRRSS